MLAEIFLLRLEMMLQIAARTAALSRPRFVPVTLPVGAKTARV